jgi:hypothetical protein
MIKSYPAQITVGPGLLEECINEGLKKRGLLDPTSTMCFQEFQTKDMFGRQKKVRVNAVVVNYKVAEVEPPERNRSN